MRLQEFLQRDFAKFFSQRIGGFENSISVQETTVTAADSNFHRCIPCLGEEAKHQAVFFNFSDLSVRMRSHDERRVTRSRVTHQAIFQIHEEIGSSDEVLLELAAESPVQAGENASGVVGVRSLASKSNF